LEERANSNIKFTFAPAPDAAGSQTLAPTFRYSLCAHVLGPKVLGKLQPVWCVGMSGAYDGL